MSSSPQIQIMEEPRLAYEKHATRGVPPLSKDDAAALERLKRKREANKKPDFIVLPVSQSSPVDSAATSEEQEPLVLQAKEKTSWLLIPQYTSVFMCLDAPGVAILDKDMHVTDAYFYDSVVSFEVRGPDSFSLSTLKAGANSSQSSTGRDNKIKTRIFVDVEPLDTAGSESAPANDARNDEPLDTTDLEVVSQDINLSQLEVREVPNDEGGSGFMHFATQRQLRNTLYGPAGRPESIRNRLSQTWIGRQVHRAWTRNIWRSWTGAAFYPDTDVATTEESMRNFFADVHLNRGKGFRLPV
ncbi:hypothetical protein CYMTET_12051 [Cymbomonas tetramitiformis]|uniref:Uncharacterized protein n=1 Tax=Cymbomonas tetramitiformis TaxID=36881 RepID=A0AAE0LCG1_9CHLO|nr:hypothetical protein CYMTET_12051 [Cymbomonas tetramitiformis]